jgi:hypothetical protein
MESLLSVNSAACCEDACYDSTNNINNKTKQRLLPSNRHNQKFVPEIEEIRINPIISRRGYMNLSNEKGDAWIKKFIVIRRPLLFIYNNEKDPVERMLINLSKAKIIYNEDLIGISQVFLFLPFFLSFF